MFPIFIDTRSLSAEFNLTKSQVDQMVNYVVKHITGKVASQWQKEAYRGLGSTKEQYARSIVAVDEGQAKGAVVLLGKLPNMIESGASSFDIKTGLLKGPNAKIGKNGKKYNTVPFSFQTPSALGSAKLPKEVYDVVQSKPQDIPMPGGGVRSSGLTADEIPSAYSEPASNSISTDNPAIFKEYEHKSSIYEGVSKMKDPVTGQNRYGSFRRVSENSDPDSWQHPGIQAKNFAEKAMDAVNIPYEVGIAIDQFLSKIGRS